MGPEYGGVAFGSEHSRRVPEGSVGEVVVDDGHEKEVEREGWQETQDAVAEETQDLEEGEVGGWSSGRRVGCLG